MPFKEFIRSQHGDKATQLINRLDRIEKKIVKTSNHLTFLLRCRDNNIVPRGLQLKSPVKSPAALKIIENASKRLVRERIRSHRSQKAACTEQAQQIHASLESTLSQEMYQKLCKVQDTSNRRVDYKTKETHKKKFAALTSRQTTRKEKHPTVEQPAKTVINLSSKTLSDDQTRVLSKGLKFAPTMRTNNHDDFISNIEKGLQQLAPGGKIDFLRHQIADLLEKSKPQRDNLTSAERKALVELKSDGDISILPADKGQATVIMDTPRYLEMVDKMLSDAETYRLLKKDPTSKLDRKLKLVLKTLKEKGEINHQTVGKLTISHPQAPYARATIKIHKDPIKARILVCSRGTVHYHTAQFIANLLAPLGKAGKSFVKDSTDFCRKITSITEPGTLVSYDVVDLFTNIPRMEAIEVIRRKVTEAKDSLDTSLSVDSIILLIELCIESTYFAWGNQFYEQTHGLPMGSPLSPIVTEIYMCDFEERALETAPFMPICWIRKVDDVFAVLRQTDDPVTLLAHLNTQNNRMKFTMEREDGNKLPFLDVLVERNNNTLQTSVFRKKTHTDQYVHYRSNHPPAVKSGIIGTLTRRAVNVCSTQEALTRELNHLRRVFVGKNGYPPTLVENVIKRTRKIAETPETARITKTDSPIFITIPYRGMVSHKAKRLLEQLASAKVVFTKQKNIKNLLNASGRKPSTNTVNARKGTIYKITCSCNATYVGETGRPLEVRIAEHMKSSQKGDLKSAISEHLVHNPTHVIQWNSVEKLCENVENTAIRKLREAIYIKRINPALNRDQGQFIPNAYDQLVQKQD